jgi:hypothetical protein
MFQPFYSLNTTPFTKELDVKHSFESEAFAEAMGRLEFLKKTRGIGLLTGEPGAGKTFSCGLLPVVCRILCTRWSTSHFPQSRSWTFIGALPADWEKNQNSPRGGPG